MKKAADSVKIIGPAVVIAAAAQFMVVYAASADYSETICWVLLSGWFLAGLAMAWFEPRPLFVYLGAVGLAAPPISYSMFGHGMLPIGGWFHALAAGTWMMPFYLLFQWLRRRKLEQPRA